MGSALVTGMSVSFKTCCGELVDDVLIKDPVAVHLTVGEASKNGGSISGEFAILRGLFAQAAAFNASGSGPVPASVKPLVAALQGLMPVVVNVDQADEIGALLRLQRDFGFSLIIQSAAEATAVADKIKAAGPKVSVLLKSRVFMHGDFDTLRYRENNAALLAQAGLNIGMSTGDADNARNLRWDVGTHITRGLPYAAGVASVTSNMADMFGLPNQGRIVVGQPALFTLWNNDPFSLQSYLQMGVSGKSISCLPQQL